MKEAIPDLVSDNRFAILVKLLGAFKIASKPYKELDLEKALMIYLSKQQSLTLQEQKASRIGRFDIYVLMTEKRYCIELKKFADRSSVAQLDRYAENVDGLILLCWQASKSMRAIFEIQKSYAKIPIALIEVKRNCNIV